MCLDALISIIREEFSDVNKLFRQLGTGVDIGKNLINPFAVGDGSAGSGDGHDGLLLGFFSDMGILLSNIDQIYPQFHKLYLLLPRHYC